MTGNKKTVGLLRALLVLGTLAASEQNRSLQFVISHRQSTDKPVDDEWSGRGVVVVAARERSICSAHHSHISVRSAFNLEIFRRCFSFGRDFLVFDYLPLIESAEARLLDRRDMNKDIFSAALRLNKSIPLVREIPEAMKPRAIPIASSSKVLEIQPTKLAA